MTRQTAAVNRDGSGPSPGVAAQAYRDDSSEGAGSTCASAPPSTSAPPPSSSSTCPPHNACRRKRRRRSSVSGAHLTSTQHYVMVIVYTTTIVMGHQTPLPKNIEQSTLVSITVSKCKRRALSERQVTLLVYTYSILLGLQQLYIQYYTIGC